MTLPPFDNVLTPAARAAAIKAAEQHIIRVCRRGAPLDDGEHARELLAQLDGLAPGTGEFLYLRQRGINTLAWGRHPLYHGADRMSVWWTLYFGLDIIWPREEMVIQSHEAIRQAMDALTAMAQDDRRAKRRLAQARFREQAEARREGPRVLSFDRSREDA